MESVEGTSENGKSAAEAVPIVNVAVQKKQSDAKQKVRTASIGRNGKRESFMA
jgi:hypothetical protein